MTPTNANDIQDMLRDCLTRTKKALDSGDAAGAQDCYHEIKGLVHSADPFKLSPSTPGSLASVWNDTRWYQGNSPSTETEYLSSLRAVFTGMTVWLLKEVPKFEAPADSKNTLGLKGSPFFKRALPIDESLVFMLMPFTESWSDRIWSKHVKPAIERVPSSLPLIARRADDLFGSDVMADVFESIMRARIVVADITNRNANVFYELGVAHTMGKRVLILAQGADHIPFDLLRFRHILYEDNSEGCEALEEALTLNIVEITEGTSNNAT